MNTVRSRLGVMMFLQYAIWGAWTPVLGSYLGDMGFSGVQIGFVFSIFPLATIFVPMLAGQLADRYFATERMLAVLHLVGGVAMIMMARAADYEGIVLWMAVFATMYAPTLALTNSICFSNIRDAEREFGGIRVWGAIGWVAAGLILGGWRYIGEIRGDLLYLAGIFALLLGVFSLALPHTPPKREGTEPFAFLAALRLLKQRNVAIFMIISFVVGTELEFYYILTAPYLQDLGMASKNIPIVMVIAQLAEIIVMAILLPRLLPAWGARKLLVLGIIAWPIRYAIFAAEMPFSVLVPSLALHGFCYVFFFVVGFIYIDKVAPPGIKASAQALVALVVMGLGRWVGSLFAGWIRDTFTTDGVVNWTGVFLVPCVLTTLAAIVFVALFRDDPPEKRAAVPA
jgi:nucleoside transporter